MRAGDEMKKAMTYDAAEFLETDEDIVAYLNAALDDGDPASTEHRVLLFL